MSTRKAKIFGKKIAGGIPPLDIILFEETPETTFKARGAMSGFRLLEIIEVLEGADSDETSEGGIKAVNAMKKFLSDAVLIEDRERFMTFLYDSDPPVGMETLQEIIQWLVEQYSGNPMEPSSPSSSGSENDGSGNTDGHYATELTYAQTNLTAVPSLPSSPHS